MKKVILALVFAGSMAGLMTLAAPAKAENHLRPRRNTEHQDVKMKQVKWIGEVKMEKDEKGRMGAKLTTSEGIYNIKNFMQVKMYDGKAVLIEGVLKETKAGVDLYVGSCKLAEKPSKPAGS